MSNRRSVFFSRRYGSLYLLILVAILFWKSLPEDLFHDPVSTVVYDRDGELLGARIASDGQWRFPGIDSIPWKYEQALLEYEDRYFRMHPGVNPVSFGRAFIQNVREGEIVSGGSTLTMQVMRMSRKNKPRTIKQKLIESFLAIRFELSNTKDDILKTYANNAPFGGNVVGIEAASWRYFGTNPQELTWAESALLAVLPNAPSLIHPGKNRELLLQKRNDLLQALFVKGQMDSIDLCLAKEEPLPEKPVPLPNLAPHLVERFIKEGEKNSYYSTLDLDLQERVAELLEIRQSALAANEIHNLACLVVEVQSGEVLAYVGNSAYDPQSVHGNAVDIITAKRSTGSILKPFLFAALLDNGDLLQTSLVPDVPVRYSGYAPKNYNRGYDGAVPAYKALERSLNIPSVLMLKRYGVDPFLHLLRNMGFTTFSRDHEHYGLTLILGGAESSLWELAGVYSSLARVLNNYTRLDGIYSADDYHMPILQSGEPATERKKQEEGLLSASSIYLTFESLLEVNRPEQLSLWYLMSSSRKIAWKTGTSYGFRDAWAVGLTPEYLVAVWAGNADGEGRPGLSGVNSAAPLMFDVFSLLPETGWFTPPLDDLVDLEICTKSGYLAGPNCPDTDTIQAVPKGRKSKACPYHYTIHLDEYRIFRVNSSCYPVASMNNTSWFVLPPLMEWYYKRVNPSYADLPPMKEGCREDMIEQLEIVYPEWDSHIVIPRELDGSRGKVILELAHREAWRRVYWHLDDAFIGITTDEHRFAIDMEPGNHRLTVIDENGYEKTVIFEVLR